MQIDNSEKEDTAEFQVIDKRKFLTIDKVDKNSLPEEKPRYPTYVEELMARMAETERKFQEKKKQIDEEIGRTRTRLESDFERKLEMETQQIVLPFLEVLDNLQRAVDAASSSHDAQSLVQGVKMTISLFRSKLASIGVETMPSLQQPFDPNLQQAVGSIEVKEAKLDGIVLEELQIGYSMKGRLLRPAQVRVGRKP
jgi:molecular chaperone GrpE